MFWVRFFSVLFLSWFFSHNFLGWLFWFFFFCHFISFIHFFVEFFWIQVFAFTFSKKVFLDWNCCSETFWSNFSVQNVLLFLFVPVCPSAKILWSLSPPSSGRTLWRSAPSYIPTSIASGTKNGPSWNGSSILSFPGTDALPDFFSAPPLFCLILCTGYSRMRAKMIFHP